MALSRVLDDVIVQEQQIQEQIFRCIDEYKDIIFNAGAGAGKTYALIESLKYIINTKGDRLNYHNQYIICITYTNVATNEIKERLGNTTLVKISTIHERLWDLIKDYQKQLVQIHVEKLNEEIEKINQKLETESKFERYKDLSDKETFISIMNQNREVFYQNKDKGANVFKTVIKLFLDEQYHNLLGNVSNFKSLVVKLYKIQDFQDCLEKIERNEEKYKTIFYDARFNTDKLHKMIISHDTLLEYAYRLIDRYGLIKQILIDQYPYILVDEYQDTHEYVVKILNLLSQYSDHINHKLFIGYFGDTVQNIYDDGVGKDIFNLHQNLENITKIFNRRSTIEVIDVINKIRNDDLKQQSIYEDAEGGLVEFYNGCSDDIDSFINSCRDDWNINQDNKLHCLVLTNELVAKYNGFENIYQKLKDTKYYKSNWQNINTEILSQDLSKLGNIPNFLYRLIEFKHKIENPQTPITSLINEKIYKQLTFKQLRELIELFKTIDATSLKSFIESMLNIYNETDNESYKKAIEDLLELADYTFDFVLDYMLNSLFRDIDETEIEESKNKLIELLEVSNDEYIAWFYYINKVENEAVIYHTYHGTKGEEYDNVVIIMQNNFGRDRNKFPYFFENYQNEDSLNGNDLVKYTNTKNLLYVSCSRVKYNLRILYLDDVSDFSSGIESIFGKISNEIVDVKNE